VAKPNANPAVKVEQWDIGRVSPYAGNAKIHPELQIKQLMESLVQFGFVNPVLVDAKGVLVAGHGRLMAAQSLGMKKVPVIKLGHLSEAQAKALRIADNTIASSGTSWNMDLLESELAHLRSVDFDLEPLGLDNIELPEIEEQVTPAPPRTNRTKTTIFVSINNELVTKARKAIIVALDKAKIPHNL
jgi:hypothetical protein